MKQADMEAEASDTTSIKNSALEHEDMEAEASGTTSISDRVTEEDETSEMMAAIRDNDISTVLEMMLRNGISGDERNHLQKLLKDEKLVFLSSKPKKLSHYTGPKDLVAGDDARNVWHLLHDRPDVAKIITYIFATEHIHHYMMQYKFTSTDLVSVKKCYGNSGDTQSVSDLLLEEAEHLLSDETPNAAGWMFIAGALGTVVSVFFEEGSSLDFPPCPCNKEPKFDTTSFFVDKKGRFYPLTKKRLWRVSNLNTRFRNTTQEDGNVFTRKHKVQLPGVKDGPLFNCFGYEIWRKEVERVKNGDWLDDSIVNVLIRNEKEKHSDVAVMDSSFARLYLVPEGVADTGGRLSLTASNFAKVEKYHKRLKLASLRVIIIPICDNSHWFLAAFYTCPGILNILCSLGKKPKIVAQSLKRYFQQLYPQLVNIDVEYPQVPRQQNGCDCGVYTIEYAINIMKHPCPEWKTLGSGNRENLLQIIDSLY